MQNIQTTNENNSFQIVEKENKFEQLLNNSNTQVKNEILEKIFLAKKIAIFSHHSPDWDAIGSSLGLWKILKNMWKEAYVFNEKPAKLFDFVDNIDKIDTIFDYWEYDLIIFVDFHLLPRIEQFSINHEDYFLSSNIIVIDHHIKEAHIWTAWIDDSFSSCCEMILELFDNEKTVNYFDEQIATYLMLGLLTDTWNFTYEKDSTATFWHAQRLSRLWANKKLIKEAMSWYNINQIFLTQKIIERLVTTKNLVYTYVTSEDEKLGLDSEQVGYIPVNLLNPLKDFDIKIIFKVDFEKQVLKLSFRSKEADVRQLANIFWGWWHKNASGAKLELEKDFEQQIKNIIQKVEENID